MKSEQKDAAAAKNTQQFHVLRNLPALLKSPSISSLKDVNRIIAAERRDVYSYAIASYHFRKERNA